MRGMSLLAFLALSLALAWPICDAFASHVDIGSSSSHSEGSGPCCASLDDRPLVASGTDMLLAFDAPSIPGSTGAPALQTMAPWPPIVSWPDRPAVSRAYYARSARILL